MVIEHINSPCRKVKEKTITASKKGQNMLRFIDIRGQGTGGRFSFFDTTTNRYVTGELGDTWDDKNEISSDPELAEETKERMISLLPGWAMYLDEDDDNDDISKGRVPNTVSSTYEEIRSELDRYGNSPHDKLFPLLDLITHVNTDLYHGGVGFDPVNDLYKELDRLSEDLLGSGNILSPFDKRVLAFYSMLSSANNDDAGVHKKNRLDMLGTDEERFTRSLYKLLEKGHLFPDGAPSDATRKLNS